MDDSATVQADLRSYYEAEAAARLRKPLAGRRVELRAEFLELLRREGRSSVLDLGSGPGGDGSAFAEAGVRYVGCDLAHGNGLLAAESALTVVQASIAAPPFRSASFEAGWSMSVLMHVPRADVAATVAAMVQPLEAGAPLLIGLWGGSEREVVKRDEIDGERRIFNHRSTDVNAALLSEATTVERCDVWTTDRSDTDYQVFWLRV